MPAAPARSRQACAASLVALLHDVHCRGGSIAEAIALPYLRKAAPEQEHQPAAALRELGDGGLGQRLPPLQACNINKRSISSSSGSSST